MRYLFLLFVIAAGAGTMAQGVDDRQLKGQLSLAMEHKDWRSVERLAATVLQLDVDDEWAWRCLSCARRNLGNPEGAVYAADEALRKKETGWGYFDLTAGLVDLGDYQRARSVANHALLMGRPFIGDAYNPIKQQLERIEPRRYEWRFKIDPSKRRDKKSKVLRFRLPDTDLDSQQSSFRVIGGGAYTVSAEQGFRELEFRSPGKSVFEILVDITVKPVSQRLAVLSRKANAALPAEVKPFLRNEGYGAWSESVLVQAGILKGKDDLQTTYKIADWFKRTIKYATNDNARTAGETLASKKGHCHQQATLFTALARANGVPCRIVRMNWAEANQTSGKVVWHSYVEVWLRGVGWVHVEPADPLSIGVIPNVKMRIGTTFDEPHLKDTLESLRSGEPTWKRLPID
ncbi:MAG: hypothetical protein HONBIEJF_02416 [Fimbriimonadaceae bacterium]|nr:hypothetical protein [Fimbriimonadaceae bacterium]